MAADLSTTNLVLAGLLAGALVASLVLGARTHLPWARWRVALLIALRGLLLVALAAWCLGLRLDVPRAGGPPELVLLADRSASIAPEGLKAEDEWIAAAREALGPRAGVIEFGREASGATDLDEAIGAARARFSGKAPKRLVILSDGRYTTADPLPQAARLAAEGGRIFTVPVPPLDGESLVADLAAPASAWKSVPLPVEALLQAGRPTTARLSFRVDGEEKEARSVQLPAGNTAVTFLASFDKEGVHQVEVRAQFGSDRLEENNAAAALVDVPLAPRVVIVASPESAARLRAALAGGGMQVAVSKPEDLPARFACDALVLDDVPATALGEPRMKAVEAFVREGGAIVFAGGPHAYAAGGYAGSPLEPVFPVLLTPQKEQPPYALVIVFDNSWSMNEAVSGSVGKINLAKEIAIAAAEGLQKGDWLALVSFDSEYHDIIPPTRVDRLEPATYEISRLGAFGMTNILGGLQQAARTLPGMDAAYRHILLISDGKETETGTDYSRLLEQLEKAHVTLSTVVVGTSANEKLMNTLAFAGKGRFYHAKTIQEIPQAVLQEAKGLENQLVVRTPLAPVKLEDDPALAGLDPAHWPPLDGYNRSRARPHAWTPLVISRKKDPLLARMRYGRGQALAYLSSASAPWAKGLVEAAPQDYATFWKQAVASVLPHPCRDLPVERRFAGGRPVFTVPAGGDKPSVWRLVGGKIVAEPSAAAEISTDGAAAVLVASAGRTSRAFAWKRTWGPEFADLAEGRQTLERLAQAGGGECGASREVVFAPGNERLARRIEPWAWLVLAIGLLVAEILVRRLPALGSLVLRKSFEPQRTPRAQRKAEGG